MLFANNSGSRGGALALCSTLNIATGTNMTFVKLIALHINKKGIKPSFSFEPGMTAHDSFIGSLVR